MTPRRVIRFGGAALCVIGMVLIVGTGSVASALGASRGDVVAGASDQASRAFWFQLAFMRLFATALIGFGALLLWCYSHLSDVQHSSLVKLLSVVLAGLALMTLGQQIAIWNSGAGWLLAGVLLLMAAACGLSTSHNAMRQAL